MTRTPADTVSATAPDVLSTSGPHPSIGERAMDFGQFVGEWDMDVQFLDEAGDVIYQQPGTWEFGWVLDGRVVQDVLVYPSMDGVRSSEPGRRRVGTTLRHVDPETGRWRVVWLGAASGIVVFLSGGRDEKVLKLEGQEDSGALLRWTFTDITPTSFVWTGWISTDGGESWRIEQLMHARRRTGGSDH